MLTTAAANAYFPAAAIHYTEVNRDKIEYGHESPAESVSLLDQSVLSPASTKAEDLNSDGFEMDFMPSPNSVESKVF